MLLGHVVAAGPPVEPGQAAEGIAHPNGVPGRLPDPHRLTDGFEGIVDAIGEVALVAQPPEQLGATRARQAVGVAKDPSILAHRLPMGTQRRGASCRLRGVREYRRGVRGGLGVVRQPRMVNGHSACRAVAQRGEKLPVNRDAPEGRHLLGDRQSGQLVPEVHLFAAHQEQSALQRFVDLGQSVAEYCFEQGQLRSRADERHDLQDLLCSFGQPSRPGEHSVANRGGHLSGFGRQRFGDKERIPASDSVEMLDIGRRTLRMRSGVLLGESPDRSARQWWQVESPGPSRGGGIAEHDAERMAWRRVLGPIGHEHQCIAAVHASAQMTNEIQSCFVGPVRVLDDEEVRLPLPWLAQDRHEAGEHVLTSGVWQPDIGGQPRQHLHQRAERRGSGGSVTRAGCHPRRRSGVASTWPTNVVLPIPASPATKTMRPCPSAASAR